MGSPSGGCAAATLSWSKGDVVTSSRRLTAEIQVRGGRLRETINDPEPLFHLRNVSAEPLVPGAVPLSGVPEGLFNKTFIGGVPTNRPQPPPPHLGGAAFRPPRMVTAPRFFAPRAAQVVTAPS